MNFAQDPKNSQGLLLRLLMFGALGFLVCRGMTLMGLGGLCHPKGILGIPAPKLGFVRSGLTGFGSLLG